MMNYSRILDFSKFRIVFLTAVVIYYWLRKVWVGISLGSPAKFSTHFCPAAAAPSKQVPNHNYQQP